VLATLGVCAISLAQDEQAQGPDEEIVVVGESEVAERRAALTRRIQELGYRPGQIRDGKVVYHANEPGKPSLHVHDDGFVVARRSPPRVGLQGRGPWGGGGSSICIGVCLHLDGWNVSGRKLQHRRTALAQDLDQEVSGWQEALRQESWQERLFVQIPDQLTALWEGGQSLRSKEETIEDRGERRAALLEFWASRTCTSEGEAVREVVATFIEEIVQESAWPVDAHRARSAEQACTCGASLVDRLSLEG